MTSRRSRVLLVAAAALLGTLGGVGTALSAVSDAGDETVDAPADPTDRSGDGTPTPDEPFLYSLPGEIHDGSDVVAFDEGLGTRSLARRDGGYLVGTFDGPDDGETLWTVGEDGATLRVGRVAPGWSVDAEGTHVLAHELQEGRLTVYDAVTGEPLEAWDGEVGPQDTAAYAGTGGEVLISRRTDRATYELLRWDTGGGTTTTEAVEGYSRMAVSPDGGLVAGAVASDGTATEDLSSCLQMHATSLTEQEGSWQTCEWTGLDGPAEFSPDGSRLLVRSAEVSDAGVAGLAVLDSLAGPESVVTRFGGSPDLLLDAREVRWADDDRVYVVGGGSTGENGWIDRCDLEGACTRLVRSETALPTLGAPR